MLKQFSASTVVTINRFILFNNVEKRNGSMIKVVFTYKTKTDDLPKLMQKFA